jgi:peptide/nickel transport system substrate-binding protein
VFKLRGAVRLGIAFAAGCCALAIAGCGGEDDPSGGTATVLMAGGPDYHDPQLAYTTKAAEASWLAYTPLLTYRHRSGSDGTELIPGLAESLPRISGNGRRYIFRLREGLRYSNGEPVRPSDFAYTIQRAIELGWGGKRFLTDHIVGAEEFDTNESETISGITTDDATRMITVELRRPYGAFSNVLAMPATGLVPAGTPMRDLSAQPPPGVGAYSITDVVPHRSWTMLRNPGFEGLDIPNIPTGSLDRIKVRVVSNPRSAVEEVIQNRADSFDPGSPLPLATLPRVRTIGEDRYEPKPIPATLYFFMNMTTAPFSSELARRAVVTALDRPALSRLGGELVKPDCYLLPDGVKGHPGGDCPYGDPDVPGDEAAARELVLESGTAGQPVAVWGEDSSPQRAYVRYYVRLLRRLGYPASERLVPPSSYFRTVGSAATNPQTGLASWFNDFPNPIDFYTVVDANAIQPTESPNLGRVNDLFVQEQLQALNLIPADELSSAADEWQELDRYIATKAYLAVFGSQQVPKLISDRLDPDSVVIHPLFLSDWSGWSLRDG